MTKILNIQGDEPVMRQMTWILEEEGFEVINARQTDGTDIHGVPDIIVINTNIVADEKRACIKALRVLVPHVHILDLAEHAEAASRDTGADQYLDKPFSAEALVAKIRLMIPNDPAANREPRAPAAG